MKSADEIALEVIRGSWGSSPDVGEIAAAIEKARSEAAAEAVAADRIRDGRELYRRVFEADPGAFLSYCDAIGGGVLVDLRDVALDTPGGRRAAAARVLRMLFWTPDVMPPALDALVVGLEHQAGWR